MPAVFGLEFGHLVIYWVRSSQPLRHLSQAQHGFFGQVWGAKQLENWEQKKKRNLESGMAKEIFPVPFSGRAGMGIFPLLLEFRLFNGPQGYWTYSQDSSKFAEKIFMCIYHYNRKLLTQCTPPRSFHHFIPTQLVLSWLRDVPFENGLLSCAYMHFMGASKRDFGRLKQTCKVS